MTKFNVFKVGGIGWVATCACLGACDVCSVLDDFKTWREAFDCAFREASRSMELFNNEMDSWRDSLILDGPPRDEDLGHGRESE